MRPGARLTLFIHDRSGEMELLPDVRLLATLLDQPPLVSRHEDGSRTLILDLESPVALRDGRVVPEADASLDTLLRLGEALAAEARALGLPRTAALAEAASLLAEAELDEAEQAPRLHG